MHPPSLLRFFAVALVLPLGLSACRPVPAVPSEASRTSLPAALLPNSAHLDYLSEDVAHQGDTLRIVHIYADAPSYAWIADDDEGAACVDDAARAAVYFLRRYELGGQEADRRTAKKLLAFVQYMQAANGLFYNFVWDKTLRINTEHPNSIAEAFTWWTARAVWALGEGARVLRTSDPQKAEAYAAAVRRTYPHLDRHLRRYGESFVRNGMTFPAWLPAEAAADATSEALLGLGALQQAYPDPALQVRIDKLAEGVERMRFGTMAAFPYGGFASYEGGWHAWGNSQTMALATLGRTDVAEREADVFYSRLLVEGWLHSLDYATRKPRGFEQIAYGVRPVAVGLARLYDATLDERYALMAGLAASWFTGNNVAGVAMYDPATGRGFDGITDSSTVNYNSGAESTVEALLTMLEVARLPAARRWMTVTAAPPLTRIAEGDTLRYRTFTHADGEPLVVVRNLSRGTVALRLDPRR